jgi:hypothetical protein
MREPKAKSDIVLVANLLRRPKKKQIQNRKGNRAADEDTKDK